MMYCSPQSRWYRDTRLLNNTVRYYLLSSLLKTSETLRLIRSTMLVPLERESEDEETREQEEESFDLIPRTPEDNEDDDNNEEDQGLRIGEEERKQEEEEADELYRDVDINQGWGLQVSQETADSHVILTLTQSDAQQEMQTQTDRLQDFIQREIDELLKTIDKNMKKIIKEQVKTQVKEQVTRILPIIKEYVNGQLKAEVLTRSSHSLRNLYAVAADLSEIELKKILIDKMEGNKREDDDQEGPSTGLDQGSKRQREGGKHASASTPSEPATRSAGRSTTGRPPTPDRDWNKTLPTAQGNAQSWISVLVKQTDARSSFNKLLDTPIDFFNFIMNQLGVDTLTPKLLAGPTYELMRGSFNSLTELEYHLEEVYKATTDQLDWVNSEGQQYPHNLLQPLPLIPDNRGRRVIPFEHFINNDLEYIRGVNRESALDVYSKRRIIAVTELKIVEWHNYKHLDWISRRVEDLQLGVESYQKRLNLTKPDTYRSDLKRREAYTAYSNPRGFIYQNKDKKNRLMRIDELHKFRGGTLNDVRNAIDDRLKGIRMQYLPTTIWRREDKDRAVAMIQAIDKMLKTRRIMRSLERFVGGRQYEGDFRMLQRTI
nr:hypothetical protein [Tanacetum cinerariifolium]